MQRSPLDIVYNIKTLKKVKMNRSEWSVVLKCIMQTSVEKHDTHFAIKIIFFFTWKQQKRRTVKHHIHYEFNFLIEFILQCI
jgi:hypothetical protein